MDMKRKGKIDALRGISDMMDESEVSEFKKSQEPAAGPELDESELSEEMPMEESQESIEVDPADLEEIQALIASLSGG